MRASRAPRATFPAVFLALAALALAGCGGGGEGASSGPSPAPEPPPSQAGASAPSAPGRAGSEQTTTPPSDAGPPQRGPKAAEGSAAFTPKPHHDSGGGAERFEQPGADNSIQETGTEAPVPEFEQAAAALHAYLDARAAGAWGLACQNLADSAVAALASELGGGASKVSCEQLLAGLSAGLPAAALREASLADVGAFRVEGNHAFLLYHGPHNTNYFMPMIRETGQWKVGAIAASALS